MLRAKYAQAVLQRALPLLLALPFFTLHATGHAGETILADPARMLTEAKRVDFAGANLFRIETSPFGKALRSIPQISASGLYQPVTVATELLNRVSWRWRVDALQAAGDLRSLATEDSAATIFFVFGEPSFFNKDVPSLAYVWSATPVANGTVLPSLRYKRLKYIQLRGPAEVGSWQTETRNVAEDYRAVFGTPPEPLRYIAVFNDNDQTKQETSAVFGAIVGGR